MRKVCPNVDVELMTTILEEVLNTNMLTLEKLHKHDKQIVLHFFKGVFNPNVMSKDQPLMIKLSKPFSDYVETIRPTLTGHEQLDILNISRFSGVS